MSTFYLIFVGLLIICSYLDAATSTKTIFSTCLKNQFQCVKENKCIPIHRRCDADFDDFDGCIDGSHNAGCDEHRCSVGEHRCGNGYCIPPSSVCDGNIDCFDRSDEKDCAPFTDPICLRNEFRCSNGKCVTILRRCDGDVCSDGSDEPAWCSGWCPEGYVLCNDTLKSGKRKCIPKSHICNGEADCPDESDEVECDKCKNWGCSDGCEDDPEHGPKCTCKRGYGLSLQDRRTCKKLKKIDDSLHCLRNEFACKDGKKCIPVHRRCDNKVTSSLGGCSDESHLADCGTHRCLDGEHRCGSGKCIPAAWVCDGNIDCFDRSDDPEDEPSEKLIGCPGITDPDCRRNAFRCHGGKISCIPIFKRCDGIFSVTGACTDFSDEFECPENWCPEGYLRCDKKKDDGTKNCIPKSRFCDGEPDCKDGWDEKDCDKCENWGCSQFCKETSPWPECFCKEGFELDEKDKRTCKKKESLTGK